MNTRHNMRTSRFYSIGLALLALSLSILSCSPSPTRPEAKENGILFYQPLSKVRSAGINALTVLGFVIEEEESLYVEGFRPRTAGFAIGSGGESAGIWFERIDASHTQVLVNTAKSLVGIVGQKSWTDEIVAEMERTLGRRELR